MCFLTIALVPGLHADAASKAPTCAKKQTVYFEGEVYQDFALYSDGIYIKNLASNAKITNVKSSNKKVKATAQNKETFIQRNAVMVTPKSTKTIKDGETAKISFTVKQNGKSYKLSCTLTFKKFTTPCKTLTIGDQEYKSVFDGVSSVYVAALTGEQKLNVKMRSGYKLVKMQVTYADRTTKTVKNGDTLSMDNIISLEVIYTVKTKPANYQKPSNWQGRYKSPLYDSVNLIFEQR
jgi:hypothetical protein